MRQAGGHAKLRPAWLLVSEERGEQTALTAHLSGPPLPQPAGASAPKNTKMHTSHTARAPGGGSGDIRGQARVSTDPTDQLQASPTSLLLDQLHRGYVAERVEGPC